ncbi:hypothetical protein OXYTRIMIC_178 [Oxytricha trifallax]|uniref:Ubiquitin-like protease family profile domain-containing protein n=1 Tax=Oxytricha trifallax TaxID=1172189 RepID=A0A073HZ49_9SPIT|nr:hypothetical protein OXYTRIMIC_178 [Oxytricha trifallax]
MEESKFSGRYQRDWNGNSHKRESTSCWTKREEKNQFWKKVQEVRYSHRDRSKDQEALGIRNEDHFKVPLNKQMGFKSKFKIGKSNPSKKINETQSQRTSFDKHEDGSECVQRDQMIVKNIIDLTEVKCRDFDKVILTKRGWTPQITRMITIVCCPSTRVKVEKALVRKYDDRRIARLKGARESELWSEKQLRYSKEINEEWQHFDLIPGFHVQEETMEMCLKQVEEMQFTYGKQKCLILPPMVMDDNGLRGVERWIGSTNWKLDNAKFWRDQEEIENIIIPTSCQSKMKNCQNWVIMKVERNSKQLEIFDVRKNVGSLAIIQKFVKQLNVMTQETVGPQFRAERVTSKVETNQVRDPEDCGVLALLIANHLALELEGDPILQIFAKDWINMQRYYLMFNLEVGFNKMEIGKSGIAIVEEEAEKNIEKRSSLIWKQADKELGVEANNPTNLVDRWEEMVMVNQWQSELEQEYEKFEREFNGSNSKNLNDLESCMFSDRQEVLSRVETQIRPQEEVERDMNNLEAQGQYKQNIEDEERRETKQQIEIAEAKDQD